MLWLYDFLTPAVLLRHLALFLLVAAMAMPTVLLLRVVALASGIVAIVLSGFVAYDPAGLFWAVLFVVVIVRQDGAARRRHRGRPLAPEERLFHEKVVPSLVAGADAPADRRRPVARRCRRHGADPPGRGGARALLHLARPRRHHGRRAQGGRVRARQPDRRDRALDRRRGDRDRGLHWAGPLSRLRGGQPATGSSTATPTSATRSSSPSSGACATSCTGSTIRPPIPVRSRATELLAASG